MNLFDDDPSLRARCQRVVQRLENERARRRGAMPSKRAARSKRDNSSDRTIHAAFMQAAREDAELRRLKASDQPWAALDFHPESL